MVVFDSTFLLLLLRPNVGCPLDSSGKPIEGVQERLNYLVQGLERRRTRIIIPTPALSEVLVHAGAAGPDILDTLTRSTVFKVEPFDTKAAVEAALMTKAAINGGDKKSGIAATWAKVKFDRQIVAIAKVFNVSMIYSDDKDVRTLAAPESIPVTSLEELPLPPINPQTEMQLAPPREQPDLLSQFDEDANTDEEASDASTEGEPV